MAAVLFQKERKSTMKQFCAGLLVLALLALTVVAVSASVDASAENSWESKTPMPQKANGIKAVTVDGKIYVFDRVFTYVYDAVADAWTQKTAMPTPRVSYAIAAVGNKVYVIGGDEYRIDPQLGSVYSNPSDVNEAYDITTDTWETKQPLSMTRNSMDANVVDGKIYVIGGAISQMNNLNEVYDPATDSWANKTAPPYLIAKYLSCTIDNKIYIIHGSDVLIYDTETDTYSTGTSMPTAYMNRGISATTGQHAPKRIYVMGGGYSPSFQEVRVVNCTYVYDPEADSWSPAADMATARGAFAVAVLNDTIYAIGGSLDSVTLAGVQTDVVEVYTPFGYGTVQPEPEPFPTATIIAASAASATVVGAALIVYSKKHRRPNNVTQQTN